MFPGNNNLAFKVLSGSAEEINEVVNYAHTTGQEPLVSIMVKDWMTNYRGALREAVKPFVKATIDGRTNPYSRRIYQHYFDKYLA